MALKRLITAATLFISVASLTGCMQSGEPQPVPKGKVQYSAKPLRPEPRVFYRCDAFNRLTRRYFMGVSGVAMKVARDHAMALCQSYPNPSYCYPATSQPCKKIKT